MNKFNYEYFLTDIYYTQTSLYDDLYTRLSEAERKWIAQAPPGRERVIEYSNKLKRNVRIERVKK